MIRVVFQFSRHSLCLISFSSLFHFFNFMVIGLDCCVPVIVTGFTNSLWCCQNINFGRILPNWQNYSCFDTKLKSLLIQTLRNPRTFLLFLIHLPIKSVSCTPRQLSHSLLSTTLSPVGDRHLDLKPQMVLWIFCRPRDWLENRSLVNHFSQLYINGGRHICLIRQNTLGLKMHNQSFSPSDSSFTNYPLWCSFGQPAVSYMVSNFTQECFSKVGTKVEFLKQRSEVSGLATDRMDTHNMRKQKTGQHWQSPQRRHWVSTCFKESCGWHTCTHLLHNMWLCCISAQLSSVWPVVSLQAILSFTQQSYSYWPITQEGSPGRGF